MKRTKSAWERRIIATTTTIRGWREHAACRDNPEPDLWFADDMVATREAIRICDTCPVRQDCLTDQLSVEGSRTAASRFGVFGGLLPEERARIYRRHRSAWEDVIGL